MHCNLTGFIRLVFFCSICLPVICFGQNNHCAVKQSPFRISMDSGQAIYTRMCLVCHQADGLGISNMNPPLNGKSIVGDKSKLIESYQNVIPAHPELKDREVADVLTYIRNSFGNKASSVKSSEVKSTKTKLKQS
jgi:mono/diheme cytochrome c family protein